VLPVFAARVFRLGVARSVQLSQKKSSLQFKAIDQVLQTFNKETNEKQAVSYRCADIDKMVPHIMGVSKVGCSHTAASIPIAVPRCPAAS
jgi:hypothetical protein